MNDSFGNAYMDIEQAKNGKEVYLDWGFSCHKPGAVTLRGNSGDGFFFHCDDGEHFLDSCCDSSGACVGIYEKPPIIPSHILAKLNAAAGMKASEYGEAS